MQLPTLVPPLLPLPPLLPDTERKPSNGLLLAVLWFLLSSLLC